MGHKKRTTEHSANRDSWDQTTYQTGSTHPPKSRSGVIAFLLGLVIFLSGISTALGLMNIRLFRQLAAQPTEDAAPVAFGQEAEADLAAPVEASVQFSPGFSGQTVSEFWNLYQEIPEGIYITEVHSGSAAEKQGLLAGDILTCVGGTPVTSTDQLCALFNTYPSGQTVEVTVCRASEQLTVSLPLE